MESHPRPDSDIKVFILVNSDLKMSKGKIATQCCHSISAMIRWFESSRSAHSMYKVYADWISSGEAKIVLRSTHGDIVKLAASGIRCFTVKDAGRTQVPIGSLTCCCTVPLLPYQIPDIIKTARLL